MIGRLGIPGIRANIMKNPVQKMVEDDSPHEAAGMHYIDDVIEPRKTRDFTIEALEICQVLVWEE